MGRPGPPWSRGQDAATEEEELHMENKDGDRRREGDVNFRLRRYNPLKP